MLAEPDAENGHQEGKFQGEDGLDGRKAAEVEGGELEEEGGDHEAKTGQPDFALQGVGHEAPAQGRLLGGGLEAHPLEDGGESVGQRSPDCQYVGHNHLFYRMGPGGEHDRPVGTLAPSSS